MQEFDLLCQTLSSPTNSKLQLKMPMSFSTSEYLTFHYFLRHPKAQPSPRPFDTLLPSNASLQAKEQSARLP